MFIVINWLVFLSFAAAAAVLGYRWWILHRRRRSRDQLRHVVGAVEWWGKR